MKLMEDKTDSGGPPQSMKVRGNTVNPHVLLFVLPFSNKKMTPLLQKMLHWSLNVSQKVIY